MIQRDSFFLTSPQWEENHSSKVGDSDKQLELVINLFHNLSGLQSQDSNSHLEHTNAVEVFAMFECKGSHKTWTNNFHIDQGLGQILQVFQG